MFLKRKMMIITIVLCCLIIFTACQPTPQKEIVVGKSEDDIQQMIDTSQNDTAEAEVENYEPIPNDYQAPDRLECVVTSNFEGSAQMEIRVDAQVIVPEYTLPLCRIKYTDIPYESISAVLDILSEGNTMYRSIYTSKATLKADIQRQIDHYNYELEYAEDSRSKEHYKEEITQLLQEYEKAPATYQEAGITADVIDENARLITTPSGEEIWMNSEGVRLLTEEEMGPFILNNDNYTKIQSLVFGAEVGSASMLQFNAIKPEKFYSGVYGTPVVLFNRIHGIYENGILSLMEMIDDEGKYPGLISEEEAIETAKRYAQALDSDLKVVDVAPSVKLTFTDDETLREGYGYAVYFSKSYNGVDMKYAYGFSYYSDMLERQAKENEQADQYSVPYPQECLKIIVVPDGVCSLRYQSPSELVEVLSYDAELLPFEDIEAKFKDYIRYNGYNNGKVYMDITTIQLSLMAIPEPNADTYLIVPVWDFFGGAVLSSDTTYIPDEEYWNGHLHYHYGRSLLTINALNGSVINRAEGY